MKYIDDIKKAKEARLNAYTPYSNFKVGALLRCKDGSVYTGCNIENHGIQSICAERVAFAKAISEGEKEFESIAIVGAKDGDESNKICLPCGYCRQFISEHIDKDFKFIFEDNGEIVIYTIDDLLPNRFSL